jgi:hypothetical protein
MAANEPSREALADWGKLVLRVSLGVLILLHGIAKVIGRGPPQSSSRSTCSRRSCSFTSARSSVSTRGGEWAIELQGMLLIAAVSVALLGAGGVSAGGRYGRWN